MDVVLIPQSCSGYPNTDTFRIQYSIPNGIKPDGIPYSGTNRIAFLPNTDEGREVLFLLKIAFERNLTFTVGTSMTTGMNNVVVWNGIHHKTSMTGGIDLIRIY